jgi:hypothetical protein
LWYIFSDFSCLCSVTKSKESVKSGSVVTKSPVEQAEAEAEADECFISLFRLRQTIYTANITDILSQLTLRLTQGSALSQGGQSRFLYQIAVKF